MRITESDSLLCSPPIPPIPPIPPYPPCNYCTIDMKPSQYIITYNTYQQLAFHHEINAVIDHMSTCYVLYRNTSNNNNRQLFNEILVGTAVHHYPHHFKFINSITISDIGEILLTLPYIGLYRVHCCSSTPIDIGILNIYIGNAYSLIGTTTSVIPISNYNGVIRLPWICKINHSIDVLPLYQLIPIQNKTCSDIPRICRSIIYIADCLQVFCNAPCSNDSLFTAICNDVYYYSLPQVITNLICCCTNKINNNNYSNCIIQDNNLCTAYSLNYSYCKSTIKLPYFVLQQLFINNNGSQEHNIISVESKSNSYSCCKCSNSTLFNLCCCPYPPIQCLPPYSNSYPCNNTIYSSSYSSSLIITAVSASGYPQWINTLPLSSSSSFSSSSSYSTYSLSMTKSISVTPNSNHTALSILYQITPSINYFIDLFDLSFTLPLYINIKSPYSITQFTPQVILNTDIAINNCSRFCSTRITNGVINAFSFNDEVYDYYYCKLINNLNGDILMQWHYDYINGVTAYCSAPGSIFKRFNGGKCPLSGCVSNCPGCMFGTSYNDVTMSCCSTVNTNINIEHGTLENSLVTTLKTNIDICYNNEQSLIFSKNIIYLLIIIIILFYF